MNETRNNGEIGGMIAALVDEHARLTHLFDRHQEEIVAGQYEQARESLEQFRRLLLDHIDVEEHDVLVCEFSPTAAHAGPGLYRAEHRRLLTMLEQVSRMLADVHAGGLTPRGIIDLIDAERPFKGALFHHCHREEQFLFPAIMAQYSPRAGREAAQGEASHAI